MIGELGHLALILAFLVASIQGVVPLLGAWRRVPAWMAVAVSAARAQFLLMGISYLCLTWTFVVSDFSVSYVALNSNTALPLVYKISAVWGAHEGSMLLWATVLAGWGFAVAVFSTSLHAAFRARVLAVIALVSVGFQLFLLLTSNPFERLLPAPMEGRDLNPLLQDPGMAAHPPMLYMGYVGLVVPFAFAVAALIEGRIDLAWTRWTRPWTTVAWAFLTSGIMLGSWWAYSELGWGGWWFWDPVENASFMPWLVATALIHSLAVTEQRGAFRAWTILLAISGFSLSLLGAFLVRSGVLVSVHAFATDPARGLFILAFLIVVIGSALVLYAWRAARLAGGGEFDVCSRETFLLANNVLLVATSATVLLGTLYPLLLDALDAGKISVGPPYFDAVFVPLMLPLAALLGFAPLARWKKDGWRRLWAKLRLPLLVVVLASLALAFGTPASWAMAAGTGFALWIAAGVVLGLRDRLRHRHGASVRRALGRGFIGMSLAHLGAGVFIAGVTWTTGAGVERDVRLAPGESVEVSGYSFRFDGVAVHPGPNYRAVRGTVQVLRDGEPYSVLHPEKRTYLVQEEPMTEAAVDPGFTRDLYVALGEPVGTEGAWTMRVQYKPLVRWIWLGPLMMAIGGLLAAADRRYRPLARPVRAAAPAADKARAWG
ncbi:MAG: heme lyase CcmF/NrfE family subunit [Thiotrichales bacterium]|nr:heme lyase CcmF/NrfE family subunit [Thiotrichales bacterium]MCY4348953.1 heme lyase CcmF/NrfE family subunit [Thiotrichales bacterium]